MKTIQFICTIHLSHLHWFVKKNPPQRLLTFTFIYPLTLCLSWDSAEQKKFRAELKHCLFSSMRCFWNPCENDLKLV